MRLSLILATLLIPHLHADEKVFGGAQIQEIYRIRLDRGDLLLENILEAIRKHNIQDQTS
jgi:hypothetical protein